MFLEYPVTNLCQKYLFETQWYIAIVDAHVWRAKFLGDNFYTLVKLCQFSQAIRFSSTGFPAP